MMTTPADLRAEYARLLEQQGICVPELRIAAARIERLEELTRRVFVASSEAWDEIQRMLAEDSSDN